MSKKEIWAWLKHWPFVFSLSGTIVFSWVGLLPEFKANGLEALRSGTTRMTLAATVFLAAGSIESERRSRSSDARKESLNALREENSQLNKSLEQMIPAQYLADVVLAVLSRMMTFGHTERISIYKHHPEDFLIPAGRSSSNQLFNKRQRLAYPLDQGCIGIAWSQGFAEVLGLPDPERDIEEYLTQTKNRCKIPKKVARPLTMKSRDYIAYRIGGTTPEGKAIGVIVFESTTTGILKRDIIKDHLNSELGKLLPWIISSVPLDIGFAGVKEGGY